MAIVSRPRKVAPRPELTDTSAVIRSIGKIGVSGGVSTVKMYNAFDKFQEAKLKKSGVLAKKVKIGDDNLDLFVRDSGYVDKSAYKWYDKLTLKGTRKSATMPWETRVKINPSISKQLSWEELNNLLVNEGYSEAITNSVLTEGKLTGKALDTFGRTVSSTGANVQAIKGGTSAASGSTITSGLTQAQATSKAAMNRILSGQNLVPIGSGGSGIGIPRGLSSTDEFATNITNKGVYTPNQINKILAPFDPTSSVQGVSSAPVQSSLKSVSPIIQDPTSSIFEQHPPYVNIPSVPHSALHPSNVGGTRFPSSISAVPSSAPISSGQGMVPTGGFEGFTNTTGSWNMSKGAANLYQKYGIKIPDKLFGKLGTKAFESNPMLGKTLPALQTTAGIVRGVKGIAEGKPEEAVKGAIGAATPWLLQMGPAGWTVVGAKWIHDLYKLSGK